MTFTEYCALVCAQVRWKRARDGIAAELTAHLADHAAVLADAGAGQEEAQALALEAMGDPEEIGRAFDRVYSPLWYRLEALLRWFWVLTLVFLGGVLLWTTDWGAVLPPGGAVRDAEYTQLLLSHFRNEEVLSSGEAVSSWWSGRHGRLDHAVLLSGACYLLPAGDGTYTFAFRLYDLSCNPFLESSLLGDFETAFTFTDPSGESYPTRAYYDALGCAGLTREVRSLTVTYSFLGRRASWNIPLEWGDSP